MCVYAHLDALVSHVCLCTLGCTRVACVCMRTWMHSCQMCVCAHLDALVSHVCVCALGCTRVTCVCMRTWMRSCHMCVCAHLDALVSHVCVCALGCACVTCVLGCTRVTCVLRDSKTKHTHTMRESRNDAFGSEPSRFARCSPSRKKKHAKPTLAWRKRAQRGAFECGSAGEPPA
jgi:hypothetical protein